jgi:hypothetical protein
MGKPLRVLIVHLNSFSGLLIRDLCLFFRLSTYQDFRSGEACIEGRICFANQAVQRVELITFTFFISSHLDLHQRLGVAK